MKASTEHSRKDRHTTHVGSSKDARPNVPTPDIDSNLTMAELAARYTANSSQPSSSEQPSRKIGRPAPPAGFLRKCLNLPRTCEVTDVALWDPLLAHVYPTLPPLRYVSTTSVRCLYFILIRNPEKVLRCPGRPHRVRVRSHSWVGRSKLHKCQHG